MNRLLLLSAVALPIVPVASCALDEGSPPASVGGSATTVGGTSSTTGGTTSSGGTVSTGGTIGTTGGSVGTTGGKSANGGSTPVTGGTSAGGSAQTGGSAGSAQGGASAGMGGQTGGSGGSGGTASGGTPPAGGAGAGGNPSAGAAGMPTAGAGGGGGLSISELVGKMDGYLGTYPCGSGDFTGYDCINSGCMNNQKRVQQDFMIGGTAPTVYEIQIRVRGVIEAKNYTSACMRRAGSTMDSSTMGGDFLCSGGATQNSSYNEYSLAIMSGQVQGQPSYFGLNARNGTGENHESWALNYTFSLRVQGGGTIRYTMFDSNCRQITNCGTGVGSSTCGSDQRVLDLANADPQPTMLMQPYLGVPQANGPGQWLFLDVLSVTAVP